MKYKSVTLVIVSLIFLSCNKEDFALEKFKSINDFQNTTIFQNVSFTIDNRIANAEAPMQISLVSKYKGDRPKMRVTIVGLDGLSIDLFEAFVGDDRDFVSNSLFLPPLFENYAFLKCSFIIPTGAVLYINSLSLEREIKETNDIRMHAHLGFNALETANSLRAFEMAGKSGFWGCICNPVSDKDGNLWCYHAGHETVVKDGTLSSIIPWELSSEEMKSLLYRCYNGYQHIPSFEDYCRACNEYGMKATLSIGYLSKEYYSVIKELLSKYNLLEGLTLKDGSIGTLEDLYDVFGDSVTYLVIVKK